MVNQAAPVDKAFVKLLADPRVALRAPPLGVDLADVRKAANAFLARATGPESIKATDLVAQGREGAIPARLYNAPDGGARPAIVFVHGGGFVLGNLESHDAMCRALAHGSGAVVIAADYALAPEHPFPRPLHDVIDVLAWVRREGAVHGIDAGRIAVAGDSAGAQIALAVAMEELRGGRAIAYVGLLYPLVDPSQSSPSALTYADGHMLTSDFVAYAWRAYGGETPSCRADARFDLRLADWRGFAPTTIVAAECDPLHDEVHGLAAAMTIAGVPVELHTFSGMIHGFAGLPQFTPQAEEALALLADRLARGLGTWTATRPSTGEEE